MNLPNLRLAAARLHVPRRAQRQALEELFSRTAAAFGSPVPPPRSGGPAARLAEYARFTRERAEEALARSSGGTSEGGTVAGGGQAEVRQAHRLAPTCRTSGAGTAAGSRSL